MKKPFAENVKGTVIIDRRVYKDILNENLTLMNKLEKAKEALKFYANGEHIGAASIGSSYSITVEDGTKAKDCLKEIEE